LYLNRRRGIIYVAELSTSRAESHENQNE